MVILPQTQGKILWNLEFEIRNNSDGSGGGGEWAVYSDNFARGDKGLWVASEDRWLVNANSKRVDDGPQSKIG